MAYRVLRWKPGHGPQAASKADEPATFETHGKVWTRHTPGDPCPCDPEAIVEALLACEAQSGKYTAESGLAETWRWDCKTGEYSIIGWRYADEPAQAGANQTQPVQPWTPRPGDVVRLKSGGPEMTVSRVNEENEVVCEWFSGYLAHVWDFSVACLTPAKEGQP